MTGRVNLMTTSRKTVAVLSLLLVASATLAIAPSAEAHYCIAWNPSTACGQCHSSTGLFHWHRYYSGGDYCFSLLIVEGSGLLP